MIDRDEAQKIREIFQKTGTIAETARITEHQRTTVRRVLTRDYSQPLKRRRKGSQFEKNCAQRAKMIRKLLEKRLRTVRRI